MTENYYSILNCQENATYEELKKSYQKLVKQHHPDKQNDLKTSETYTKIDEAWNILKDMESRKEYNAKLLNSKFNEDILIYATVTLQELDRHEEENFYTYNCRCGGLYIVYSNYVDENECIVHCDECSLVIKIRRK